MLKKNDELLLNIEDLGSGTEGVARHEGLVIFVPFALPNEKVRVKLLQVKKDFAFAKLLGVLEPSELRLEPKCRHFLKCGGCSLLHLDYKKGLEFKRRGVISSYKKIAHEELQNFEIQGLDEPFEYRSKAAFPIKEENGRLALGYYQKRSHRLIEIEECPILDHVILEIAHEFIRLARELALSAYDENSGTGLLRHLLIRRNPRGAALVHIVINAKGFKQGQALAEGLKKSFPEILSISYSTNMRPTNSILGDEERLLLGTPSMEMPLAGLKFKLSAHSFFQVNLRQFENIINYIKSFVSLSKNDAIYDIYCGAGSIGLCLAKDVSQLCGIEIVKEAVENARENALLNGISNAEFHLGAAEDILPGLIKQREKASLAIIDPPRKGCEQSVLNAISESGIEKIAYISCHPATQARDFSILKSLGYEITACRAFDMFCFTEHVETVALLCRKDIDSHIEVKLELDEDDVTKAESKGTYENIKEYVLDKYGFKVSTLYIAQIKRKCGLELGENYNKSKKENSKVPECPKEKEDAIIDALKRFKMIVQEEWYTKSIQTCLTV